MIINLVSNSFIFFLVIRFACYSYYCLPLCFEWLFYFHFIRFFNLFELFYYSDFFYTQLNITQTVLFRIKLLISLPQFTINLENLLFPQSCSTRYLICAYSLFHVPININNYYKINGKSNNFRQVILTKISQNLWTKTKFNYCSKFILLKKEKQKLIKS